MKFFSKRFFALLLTFSAFLLIGAGAAQKQKNPKCPTTKVNCPAEVKQGDLFKFTANVTGGDQDVTPTYNWSVSAGVIESGQGTSTIDVNTKGVAAESTITAT